MTLALLLTSCVLAQSASHPLDASPECHLAIAVRIARIEVERKAKNLPEFIQGGR